MAKPSKNSAKNFRILVYGIEKMGYTIPAVLTPKDGNAGQEPKFQRANSSALHIGNGVELIFEPFDTKEEFQNYDGVIMFQGIWARREIDDGIYSSRDRVINKQNNELRKRVKQVQQLIRKDGFICFLMGRMFGDDFDMAKEILDLFRSTSFSEIEDNEFIYAKRSELQRYCDRYGVAKTKFSTYDNDYEPLITTGRGGEVGVCFDNKMFFLPCHAPDQDEDNTKQLFTILGDGLVSLFKKMKQELPDWVEKFTFKEEADIKKKKNLLVEDVANLQKKIDLFNKYKHILFSTSDQLRKEIAFVLTEGFGYEVDTEDNFVEDLKIITAENKKDKKETLALVEVKGINGNVDRESINQVDSHRERGSFTSNFPGILIANTFIKSANSIQKKDKIVEKEQVIHAYKNHILILRTIDLLRAIDLLNQNSGVKKEFDGLLMTESGWLEVKGDEFIIHHG